MYIKVELELQWPKAGTFSVTLNAQRRLDIRYHQGISILTQCLSITSGNRSQQIPLAAIA